MCRPYAADYDGDEMRLMAVISDLPIQESKAYVWGQRQYNPRSNHAYTTLGTCDSPSIGSDCTMTAYHGCFRGGTSLPCTRTLPSETPITTSRTNNHLWLLHNFLSTVLLQDAKNSGYLRARLVFRASQSRMLFAVCQLYKLLCIIQWLLNEG